MEIFLSIEHHGNRGIFLVIKVKISVIYTCCDMLVLLNASILSVIILSNALSSCFDDCFGIKLDGRHKKEFKQGLIISCMTPG
jgi:hypothetical protein